MDIGCSSGVGVEKVVLITSPIRCEGVYGDLKIDDAQVEVTRPVNNIRGFNLNCQYYDPRTNFCSNTIGENTSKHCLIGYAIMRANYFSRGRNGSGE
ncbi:hypothetical protein HY212_07890 [Candidatus Pacearchaeota archaeon]|nr:hypothetical protein [Candidatus Pacearchaeota archaeon]